MASKKTSTKPQKPQKKFKAKKIEVGGHVFETYSPAASFAAMSRKELATVLVDVFLDGDKDAFQDILESYLRSKNLVKLAANSKLSRTTIYDLFDKEKDPRMSSVFKMIGSIQDEQATA